MRSEAQLLPMLLKKKMMLVCNAIYFILLGGATERSYLSVNIGCEISLPCTNAGTTQNVDPNYVVFAMAPDHW